MAKIVNNIDKKGEVILKRFGKYLLLDHLVNGGMAKICRARYLDEQVDKIVAIKMIQARYSDDETFRKMFMDEIKVTFGLIHPNIAQTYDYGLNEGQLYTAMEYVNGKNLKEYLEKLKKKKYVFPVEISVYIISQVCQGLHYAHNFTDMLSGQKSNIIHRDISPHNIMLTYDGAVKVIDFGIAKVDSNEDSTKAGTIKGKLSYLAPEYLEGLKLDHRYDQFAVGNTLWEMLCSRKLFKAPNEIAVLKEVQSCKVPRPSSINPIVPKELDEIVLKALSKDRNKRYANLDQLNRALVEFLYKNYPTFNPTDLSYFAKGLFKKDIEEDRKRLFEFGKIDVSSYIAEAKYETPESIGGEKSAISITNASKIKQAHVFDFGFDNAVKSKIKSDKEEKKSEQVEEENNQRIKLDKTKTGASINKGRKTNSVIKNGEIKINKIQDSNLPNGPKTITNSNNSLLGNRFIKSGVIVALLAVIAIFVVIPAFKKVPELSDKKPQTEQQNLTQETSPKNNEIKNETPKVKLGKITLKGFDTLKHKVYVNDEKVKVNSLGTFSYPYSDNIFIRVEQKGRKHFVYHLQSFSEGNSNIRIQLPDMPPQSYAFLKTARNCFKGKMMFEVFGETRSIELPIRDKKGIAIPLLKDGRNIASPFRVILIGEDSKRPDQEIEIIPKSENELIDMCEVIYK